MNATHSDLYILKVNRIPNGRHEVRAKLVQPNHSRFSPFYFICFFFSFSFSCVVSLFLFKSSLDLFFFFFCFHSIFFCFFVRLESTWASFKWFFFSLHFILFCLFVHTIRCVCTRETREIYMSIKYAHSPVAHTKSWEKEKKKTIRRGIRMRPKKPHTIKCPKSFILLSHKYSRMTYKIATQGEGERVRVSERDGERGYLRIVDCGRNTHILFSTLCCLHLYIFISTTMTHDIHIMVFRHLYELCLFRWGSECTTM